jgi:cation diffusion facilitator CzcD-associated flavoprotein CzcO/acetyl esterase/lipase
MIVYRPKGFAEAVLALMLRWSLKLLLKPVFSPRFPISFQRRWLALIAKTTLVPRGVEIKPDQVGGVAGEWLQRSGLTPVKKGAVLYLHGGAYCVGSAVTHRSITARISLTTGLPVFAANYRLAPEHPFPAALQDALAIYKVLATQGPVVLAGDSAGGGLALATALALRDAGGPKPAALVLFSPWVDMSMEDAPAKEPPGEAMLSLAWAKACAAHYLSADTESASVHSPQASPLKADLRGLPPTLIQAGTDEMLHGQALALEQALMAANVQVQCEITTGRWHVFQAHGGVLKSADDAIARVARFLALPLAHAAGPSTSTHEVVILGAGMSGLCMGIQLQRAGIHDFVILEKQPGLGGTWWDNTYPGAHVDVPAPAYSFSFAPNPDWKRRFASAQEIQTYMQDVAQRHQLLGHIRLATQITQASFNEDTGHWDFKTDRGDTLRSRFFVCSTGPLNQLRWPDIPGLEEFQGQRLHSARWDHAVPITGQRVAVIGTGSTASQLIPPIAQQARQLHVFQRTANWVLPRLDRPYNFIDRALAYLPLYSRVVRWTWVQLLELGRRGFDEGTLARKAMLQLARSHLRRGIPDPALQARLQPPYPLGCKRLIYSNDFYPALAQKNVELVTEPIERITPRGVLTRDGMEREIDVLVCATGFETTQLLSSIQVSGTQGMDLRECWSKGPEAYQGITVAGFPNMFLMLGPNTITGHTSTLLYIEPEVRHAITCMQAVRSGGHRWIDIRPEIYRAHNDELQARLQGSVWSLCRSWYRTDNGRIVALFPGFTREYVQSVSRPAFQNYRFG